MVRYRATFWITTLTTENRKKIAPHKWFLDVVSISITGRLVCSQSHSSLVKSSVFFITLNVFWVDYWPLFNSLPSKTSIIFLSGRDERRARVEEAQSLHRARQCLRVQPVTAVSLMCWRLFQAPIDRRLMCRPASHIWQLGWPYIESVTFSFPTLQLSVYPRLSAHFQQLGVG